jgi:hypothetical protein
VVGADGFCSAHSGKVDMRELGRRGGSKSPGTGGRKPPTAARGSLRERLRTAIGDEQLVTALEKALAGSNTTAQVAAIRLLADWGAEDRSDFETQRQAWMAELADAKEVLLKRLELRARAVRDDECESCGSWLAQLEQLKAEFLTGSDRWVPNDVDAKTAEIVLQGLVDIGLIRPQAPTMSEAEELIERRLAEATAGLEREREELKREREEFAAQRAEFAGC